MIREIELSESKHYGKYKYNTTLYISGIKADTCLIIDDLEVYYDKLEEIIYFESFESFPLLERPTEGDGQITNKMLKEIINYLGWKKWSIKLHYYDYEEAVISIKKIGKKKTPKSKRIRFNSLAENYQKNITLNKVPNII